MILKAAIIAAASLLLAETGWAGTITGTVSVFGKPKANAAVHLVGPKVQTSPPKDGAVIVQKGQQFIPEVLSVVKGTLVHMPNKDTVIHNAFSLSAGNDFDLGSYRPGETPSVQFDTPGLVDIFCNQHEQMHGIVVVLEHPYFDQTDKKGLFSIQDVPAGTYTLKAWANAELYEEKSVTVPESGTVKMDFDLKK